MKKIVAGAVAGFAATVVLSVMMVAKGMMGIMPELDVIAMLSAMMGAPPTSAIAGGLAASQAVKAQSSPTSPVRK